MYTHMPVHIYIYTHTHKCTYTYIYIYIHTQIHIYAHIYIHMHIYIYIYTYIYVYIYIYVIYTHRYVIYTRKYVLKEERLSCVSSRLISSGIGLGCFLRRKRAPVSNALWWLLESIGSPWMQSRVISPATFYWGRWFLVEAAASLTPQSQAFRSCCEKVCHGDPTGLNISKYFPTSLCRVLFFGADYSLNLCCLPFPFLYQLIPIHII